MIREPEFSRPNVSAVWGQQTMPDYIKNSYCEWILQYRSVWSILRPSHIGVEHKSECFQMERIWKNTAVKLVITFHPSSHSSVLTFKERKKIKITIWGRFLWGRSDAMKPLEILFPFSRDDTDEFHGSIK